MIKAVIFDCFGVLTTDKWRAFVDGLPEGIDTKQARELNRQYGGGFIDKSEFLEQIAELTGHSIDKVEELLDNEDYKNTALLSYISELKRRGYKIGLLSNVASNWIRDKLLSADDQKLFDDMVFSYEVGMTKPDPRIFHHAVERLGVELDEAVLVDDIDRYGAVADGEGMKSVTYHDLKQAKDELEKILSNS